MLTVSDDPIPVSSVSFVREWLPPCNYLPPFNIPLSPDKACMWLGQKEIKADMKREGSERVVGGRRSW